MGGVARSDAATESSFRLGGEIMAGNLPFSEKLNAEIGPEERWFSAAAGACLVGYGLSRISLRTLAAMAVGGYLVYRGSTGKCPVGDKLAGVSDRLAAGYQNLAERAQSCCGGVAQHDAVNLHDNVAGECEEECIDPVDEAAMESFPASDPPSHVSGNSTPSSPPIT